MSVPFVDCLTTNLDHSLPLTAGEFNEFGNAKENKDHFDYIRSYSPYENIKKMNYPNILVTTSLSDNRVLFDEPTKYVAKLREYKKDQNLLLFKCEMDAGHSGRSGRDAAIEEIAFDYAFALKIAKKIWTIPSWKNKNNTHIIMVSRLMGLIQSNLANKGGYYDK